MLDVNKVHRHFQVLVDRRMSHESTWREVATYYLPTSMTWASDGKNRQAYLRGRFTLDDTPAWAAGRFAAALLGMIMNPSQKWLEFEMYTDTEELSDEGKLWLGKLRDKVLQVFQAPEVGFYDAMHEHLLDYAIFGESVMLIDRNPETNMPRFTPYPLEQSYVGLGPDRKPNQMFRKYEMTAEGIKSTFGEDKLPEKVKRSIEGGKGLDTYTVIHGVFPRGYGVAGGFDTNKPYASLYYLECTKDVLKESGFDTFPFSIPRFMLFASEEHGQGPGTLSLNNVRTLNSIIKTTMTADQSKASPAYIAQRRGFLKPLDFSPRKVNYFDGYDMEKAIMAIGNEGTPSAGKDWVEMYQEQIIRAFYLDRLIAAQKAAEVKEIEALLNEEERMRDLIPQLSRLHAESISRVVLNTALMCAETMDPPPPEIGENTIKIRYLSPLARAQKMLEVTNANRTIQQIVLPLAQVDPAAAKAIDFYKFTQWSLDQAGFPTETRVSEEQFRQQQAAAEQQQQIAQGLEAATGASEIAKNFSQAQAAAPVMDALQGFL